MPVGSVPRIFHVDVVPIERYEATQQMEFTVVLVFYEKLFRPLRNLPYPGFDFLFGTIIRPCGLPFLNITLQFS
jgi:hypothetical protein